MSDKINLDKVSEEELVDYMRKNFFVDDVFTDTELQTWAKENGYTKGE